MEKQTIKLNDIYPIIKEQIESGGTVDLPIKGTSMLPLLYQGRDFVKLQKCENANIGDIIFYRRDNGHFVLHRIVGKDEKGYILCGDNQWVKEFGIEDRHIIAVVTSINRKGKVLSLSSKGYRAYCNLWQKILPVRRPLILVINKIITIKMSISRHIGKR